MQVLPLIKKNLIYIKRNLCSSIITLFFPIIFILITITLFNNYHSSSKPIRTKPILYLNTSYPSSSKFSGYTDILLITEDHTLFSKVESILSSITQNNITLSYTRSKTDLKNTNKIYDIAFIIDISPDNTTSFEIITGQSSVNDITFKVKNSDLINIENAKNPFPMINRVDYIFNAIAHLLIKYYSTLSSSRTTLTIHTSSLSYDLNDISFLNKITMSIIPTVYMMTYFSLFFQFVMMMVNEKENKLKDLLYRQGVTLYTYFFSFQITFVLISLLPILATSILLHFYCYTYTSIAVIFLFVLMFICNLVAIGYLMQMVLSTSRSGQTLAKVFFIAITLLSSLVKQPECSSIAKGMFIFFPQMLFNISFEIMSVMNNLAITTSFSLTDVKAFALTYNEYSLVKIFALYVIDYVLYFMLALIIEAVQMSNLSVIEYVKSKYIHIGKKVQSRLIEYNEGNHSIENVHQEIDRSKRNVKYRLNISNLRKSYGDVHAVKDFSCTLYSDEIFVLLGHNGAGKTTLIKMISGIENCDRGDLTLNNKSLYSDRQLLYRNIGLCSQDNTLFPELTVREHLEIISQLKGSKADNAEILDLVSQIDLNDKIDEFAKNLSEGQKRRLCISLALIGKSSLVLLDEPTSGMDFKAKKFIWDFLKKYKKDRIILLTTHSLEEAQLIHDCIGIMSEGYYICSGTSEFLKSKFSSGVNVNFIVDKEKFSNSDLVNFIKELKHINNSLIIKAISNEVIMVNFEHIDNNIDELFAYINTTAKMNFNIKDFTVSTSSLEDVFLKVNNNTMSKELFNEIDNLTDNHIMLVDDINQFDLEHNLKSKQNFFSQLCSGLNKNFRYTWRNKGSFILELLTSVMTIIFLILSLVSIVHNIIYYSITPPLLSTRLSDVFFTDLSNTANYFNDYFTDKNYPSYPLQSQNATIPYIVDYIYTTSKYKSEKAFIYLLSFNVSSIEFAVLHRVDIPEEVIFISNIIYAAYLKNEFGVNSEMIRSLTPNTSTWYIDQSNYVMNYILNVLTITLLVTILVNISGYNIITPLRERLNHVKQLQCLSGANMLSYWTSMLIVDTTKLFVFIALLLPVIINYLSYDMFSLLFLILCFAISINLFLYFFSFFVSREEDGQKFYLYIMMIGTIFLPLIGVMKNIFVLNECRNDKRNPEEIIFSGIIFDLLPSSTLVVSLVKLFIIFLLSSLSFGIEKNSIKAQYRNVIIDHLEVTACQCVVYSLLLFLMEKNYLVLLFIKIRNLIISKAQRNVNESLIEKNSNEYIDKELDNLSKKKSSLSTTIYKLYKTYYPYYGLCNCICKKKNTNAVVNLSVGLSKNEKFGLLGSNGSGKTTTFKCLIKELIPDKGMITFFSHDIEKDYELIRQNLGYCPQENSLFDYLTVNETISYYAKMKNIKLTPIEIAYKFSLDKYLNHLCINLSGGNKRKLSFAIAIMNNPKIILLDEPSTGVDPESRRVMWKNIHSISKNNSAYNMILSTHSTEEAEVLCDRIGWMEKGNFTHIGNPEVLKMKFSDGYFIHIKFNIVNKEKENKNKRFGKITENVLGIDKFLPEIEEQNNYWGVNLLWDVIKDIRDYCGVIEMIKQDKGCTFDMKLSIIEGEKGKLISYLLKLKNKEKDKVSEISFGLKSLEEIFEGDQISNDTNIVNIK